MLEGSVLRRAFLGRRPIAQLLGPGDVVAPVMGEGVLPLRVEYTVVRSGVAAVLDQRFAATSRRWPPVADELARRRLAQEHRAVLQLAIMALPRVEQRLLAMLWHLAELFGRMTGAARRSTSTSPTTSWAR